MYKLLVGLTVLVLFVGCSSKEEKALLHSYEQNTQYHKNLQQTEKTEIYDGNTSLATLTATYLYTTSYEKNDTRDEVFIVGVVFENPELSKIRFDMNSTFDKDKNITLTNENEYVLSLNKNRPIKVTPLKVGDKKLEGISFVADWGSYYEVTYPHAGKRFSLTFENAIHGKSSLIFSKVAKFVYTKKGF